MIEHSVARSSEKHEVSAESAEVRQAGIDLAAAHRLAVIDGLHEGTWNHFSLMVPGSTTEMFITPPFVHWSQICAQDLVRVGSADTAPEARNSLAWVGYRIHYPVHRARLDAACVLHAHPPYATALSMLDHPELAMAEQTALGFFGRLAVTTEYDGSVDDGLGHGAYLARQLGDCDVLVLRNHGVLVVGESVAAAYTDLYLLERAARVQVLALSTNQPLRTLPDDRVRAMASGWKRSDDLVVKASHFEAMKRLLDAQDPSYAS